MGSSLLVKGPLTESASPKFGQSFHLDVKVHVDEHRLTRRQLMVQEYFRYHRVVADVISQISIWMLKSVPHSHLVILW